MNKHLCTFPEGKRLKSSWEINGSIKGEMGRVRKGKNPPAFYSGGQNKNYEQTLTLNLGKTTAAILTRSFGSLPSI